MPTGNTSCTDEIKNTKQINVPRSHSVKSDVYGFAFFLLQLNEDMRSERQLTQIEYKNGIKEAE